MATARPLALGAAVLLLAACGGDSEPSSQAPAAGGEQAVEAAYQDAYRAAWVKACKAAVGDIRRRNGGPPARQVDCGRPVEQMEGNTSFDPQEARREGRHQGTFDGCAYAWEEAYATAGEVEPRC